MKNGLSVPDPDQPLAAFINSFAHKNDALIKEILTCKRAVKQARKVLKDAQIQLR